MLSALLRGSYKYSKVYNSFGDFYQILFYKFLVFFDLSNVGLEALNRLLSLASSLQLASKVCYLKGVFFSDSFLTALFTNSKFLVLYANELLPFSKFFTDSLAILPSSMLEPVAVVYDSVFFGRAFNGILSKVEVFSNYMVKDYFFIYSFILKSFFIVNRLGIDFLTLQMQTLLFVTPSGDANDDANTIT